MKISRNNKGFSLVELLIAVAIAAIVGASVFGFMTVGAKTFGVTSTDVNIQNEAQLAFNQIQDLVIDTVIGIDYVYYEGTNSDDDSHKVATDAAIPATAAGKKLIMYNSLASGRNVYEIIWKKDEKKLYYSEYNVAIDSSGGADKVVKGANIVKEALLGEYVTGFVADVSQVETKRVVRLELTYTKGNKNYTSAHNITLRNKIVSGNVVPSYMVSDNTVPLSKNIEGPEEIYMEPGDVSEINDSYVVKDVLGNVSTGMSKHWDIVKTDGSSSKSTANGSRITLGGKLEVSAYEDSDFIIRVTTADGLASKEVTVKIIRINTIDGLEWTSEGSIGTGEISGGSASPEDIIEGESFKITVTGVSGTNLGAISFNGNTVDKKVVFIKTKGEDLFDITEQDGTSCKCRMKDSFGTSSGWVAHSSGTKTWENSDIAVTAVSVYSLGGRGFSTANLSTPNISFADFDYTSATSNPTSVGASTFKSANRYMNSTGVAPVFATWTGKAYKTKSSFNIKVPEDSDLERGVEKVNTNSILFSQNGVGVSLDAFTKLDDGTPINTLEYVAVLDYTLLEIHHNEDGSTTETTKQHFYDAENTVANYDKNWKVNCPKFDNADTTYISKYSPNSEFVYTATAYLIKVTDIPGWTTASAGHTYTSGNCCVVMGADPLITEDVLKKAKYASTPATFHYYNLQFSFDNVNAADNIIVSGQNNERAAIYLKEFGKVYDAEQPYNLYLGFDYSTQFNQCTALFNSDKWHYMKANEDGTWSYAEDNFVSTIASYIGQGQATDKRLSLTNYKFNDFYNKDSGHLRIVPKYTDSRNSEYIYNNYIDVYIWNITIPEFNIAKDGNDNNKKVAEQHSYFPVPTDYNFGSLSVGRQTVWKGALLRGNNRNVVDLYYTLSRVGELDSDKPSYNLKLEYMDTSTNKYTTVAEYSCGFDDREWKQIN
ncbi:MAG: prepilin-type N-terminal cleavage/methylation domain-containing protein [Lachnospiraceae bacterium]|nr:prepilin-type N-terminal cleavage/methylation domain-containing protein [Lachnospiraceae bacterium]